MRELTLMLGVNMAAIKACSHGEIATAIYLLQLMSHVRVGDVVTIASCEPLY